MIFSTTSQDRHRRRHQARQDHLQGAQRPHSRFQPVPAKGARSLDPDPRSDDSRLSRARRRRSISRHRAIVTSAELFSKFARSPHPRGPTPTITPPLFSPAAIHRASSFFGAAFSLCDCFFLGKPERYPGPRLTSPSRVAFSNPGSRDPCRGR